MIIRTIFFNDSNWLGPVDDKTDYHLYFSSSVGLKYAEIEIIFLTAAILNLNPFTAICVTQIVKPSLPELDLAILHTLTNVCILV